MPIIKSDTQMSESEYDRLRAALGPGRNVGALAGTIAKAGATELLAQATGLQVFSSIADLRMYRIYCLLKQGINLDDAEALVAVLFKVAPVTARRMVQAALARYDVDLQADIDKALATVLDAAEWDGEAGKWQVKMGSGFIRDRLSSIVATQALLVPDRSTKGGVWKFADETYTAIRAVLKLEPKAHA
jgi:hypothetical protein